MERRRFLAASLLTALVGTAACGGDNPPSTDMGADMTTTTADMTNPGDPDMSSPGMTQVTFSYQPGWAGVTEVAVIGAFGQASDWTTPLVTLASDNHGGFTGTAMLAAGQYPYLFRVTGDKDATPMTLRRESLDPMNPHFVACPMGAPSYNAKDSNPCSQLTVGSTEAPVAHHIKGTVTYDAKPVAGYLVVVERDEQSSHHYFVNRVDSAADGTFDLSVASGSYRVQVQHPSLLKLTDATRNPTTLQAVRRAISGSFPVAADKALAPIEVAYHDYDKLIPAGGATVPLPFTFQFTLVNNATAGHVAIYGLGSATAKDVGDPWFTSTVLKTSGSVTFDGTFNTAQKGTPQVVKGTLYYWGTEETVMPGDKSLSWLLQSMVLPITFR